ncbi:glycoside hydrolase family 3 N-terminal domain-containing protein [Chitinimonas lacunae]|uniref:Glycoside hydrolase family 3 N-terminal domain-containing protein n=1 Tax=Chitinimonas lacunae TaxID=1963018 RepID=A0ABV8MS05_9NEIS
MTLSPAQLAGRLLMVDIAGERLEADEAEFLRRHHIGAVCLFRRNVGDFDTTCRLLSQLRELLGPTGLVAIDQEGGAVMRTLFMPEAPSAMALGAADDEALAYRIGEAVGRGLAALGINWNLAPVLDLNCNPHNPVIAERSFGADPERAARLAGAWLDGHLAAGVATCVKHFPGHGDTQVDSHLTLPVVDKPREALERYELAPFRLLSGRTPGLMSAHIVFPAFDPVHPATLAPALLDELLRQQWGYQGVVITDGMNMKAIHDRYGQAEGTVLALAAGADLSLVLQYRDEMAASHAAIVAAIEQGRLDPQRLLESARRLDQLATRFPLGGAAYPSAAQEADRALMAEGWRRGLTAYRQPPRLPVGSRLRLVVQAEAASDGVSEAGLKPARLIELLQPHYQLDVVSFARREALDWAGLPHDGVFTVLASTTRARYGERERQSWRPDLHLALWNPYAAADLDAPALVSYGFAPPALAAVVDWLSGRLDASGRAPAPLTEAAEPA